MQIKDQFKEHWRLGAGWKMTVVATTLAAAGGVALASPGTGGADLPPIDLENPTVLDVGDDFQVVPGITVPFDDDSDADSPFASADTDDSSEVTSTTLDDDSDDSSDVTSTTLDDDSDDTSTTLDDDSDDSDDSDDDSADDSDG